MDDIGQLVGRLEIVTESIAHVQALLMTELASGDYIDVLMAGCQGCKARNAKGQRPGIVLGLRSEVKAKAKR
ncbi:hypothetical protein X777_12982 [Ooceraea biroi]|uniref:Uncharacterized protein n=1 Tax=Ooceraea biroi TaxID=2015173 RepID=A0A026VXF2_OOCBI|nr:hypothetical protein X777_12982 [Ooceraea biroi]